MHSQLANAKAWAAFIGAIVTALLGTLGPDDALFDVLTALAAVLTAVATYAIPNTVPSGQGTRVARDTYPPSA